MKVLQILVLIFGLSIFTIAQDKEKLFVLSGIVYDAEKSLVPVTEITAKNKDGRKFQTFSNEKGVYRISIPFREYTVAFRKDGFKKSVYTNVENLTADEKKIDVSLEITTCYDCGVLIAEEDKESKKDADNRQIVNAQNKSRFCGTITDEQGAVILNATVEGKSSKGNSFKINTDSNGNFDTEIFDGLYKILIKADSFKKVVMKNKLLPFEPRMCIQVELKSSVPPHQIT